MCAKSAQIFIRTGKVELKKWFPVIIAVIIVGSGLGIPYGLGFISLTHTTTTPSALNYTVGNSYYFGVGTQTELVKVVNITLNSFNYTMTSDFANYWEDSFYTQLPHDKGSSTNFNVTINKFDFFKVTLSNDKLFFGMTTNDTANGIPLYSISTLYENFLVTQV